MISGIRHNGIRADKPPYSGIIVFGPVIVKADGIRALAREKFVRRSDINCDLFFSISLTVSIPPFVNTDYTVSVGTDSACLSCNLTSTGTSSSAYVSLEWGLNPGNYTFETPVQTLNNTGIFYDEVTGLPPNTTYYCRAKAYGRRD